MQLVTVDFDGTLFQGDSFSLMFKAGKKEFGFSEWMTVLSGSLAAVGKGLFKGKNALRVHFFKTFAGTFKGKTKEELSTFFDHLITAGEGDINLDLVKEIKEHQKKGNQVIIVSGALKPFLEALTERIKLDVTLIGTDLLFDADGKCTGETSAFINGEEKVQAVKKWMETYSTDTSPIKIWAYADSESDIPLLQYVDYPIIVNPKDKMKTIAAENNWPLFGGR